MSTEYKQSQFSSACDGITTGPYTNIVAQVGGYIYKNAAGQTFKDHIKGCLEVNAGAHYYVQSQYSANYAVATARIDLSKVSVNVKKNGVVKRHGFLSLSIVSEGTKAFQCDIGLGHYGNGWMPITYCKGQRPDTGSGTFGLEVPLDNQNAVVDITYTVSKTAAQDKIVGVFKVGSQTVAQVTYTAKAGELFRNGGTTSSPKPLVRFVRFMSLVPLSATTDDADNTTMEATMTNFKLGSRSWDKSLIEYAWSVQGANIESLKIGNLTPSTVGTNADYIKINHRYQLH